MIGPERCSKMAIIEVERLTKRSPTPGGQSALLHPHAEGVHIPLPQNARPSGGRSEGKGQRVVGKA